MPKISELTTAVPTTDDFIPFVDNADGTTKKTTVSAIPFSVTIPDDSVTFAKLQNINTNRILGRSTAGTGDIEELNTTAIPALIGLWTSDSPQFTWVNVWHATDTTISRVSAWRIAVEGVNVPTISSTDTLTNKNFTSTTNVISENTTTASSTTPTPTGGSLKNYFTVTALAAGATFSAPSGTPVDGNMLLIRIKDNWTARTLAWNAIYRGGDTALPTTTILSKTLYLLFIYNSIDARWDLISKEDNH